MSKFHSNRAMRGIVPSHSIAYVVLNGIYDDARVLKTAYTGRDFGFDVTVYGMTATREADEAEFNGIRIKRIANPRYGLPAGGWPSDPESRDIAGFVRLAATRVWALMKEQRPALLHTHDMYGLYIGAFCQNHYGDLGYVVPWVHDVHEFTDGLTNIPKKYLATAIAFEDDFIRQPDRLFTVSPPIVDHLTGKYRLSQRPELVLNCPSRKRKGSGDIRSSLGLGEDVRLFVYSGNLGSRERGAHTMVEALPYLASNVHAAFVSAPVGPVINEVREIAGRLGVESRIHVHPYVPNDEVTSFLSTADLGCHPITHFPNGEVALPNKLFEYLHAGLPVIASDVEEMKKFVRETGIGDIFIAENPEDLARSVRTVLESPATFTGRITEELRASYSWEAQEFRIKEVYAALLERARHIRAEGAASRGKTLEEMRIFHGPVAVAGQPWMIANAERQIGLRSDHVLLYPTTASMGYPAHRTMTVRSGFSSWSSVARVVEEYDLLHLYARPLVQKTGAHLFPSAADMLAARAMGLPVVMHFLGSEVRMASRFRALNPFHWLDEDDSVARLLPEEAQVKFIEVCRSLANRMVVLDPEMLTYVPDARIVERAIELSEWSFVGPVHERRPRIVHAPSRRLFKGTEFVLRAVEELRNEGEDFEFELLEGLTNQQVKEAMKGADVVVDQLRIGWYGVLACEAMALGKPVVAYIREDLVGHFNGRLPLAPSDPLRIKETLRGLIRDPEKRRTLGAAGRAFAEEVHDARIIAEKFRAMYRECLEEAAPVDFRPLASWFQYQERAAIPVPLSQPSDDGAAEKSDAQISALAAEVERLREGLRLKKEDYQRLKGRYLNLKSQQSAAKMPLPKDASASATATPQRTGSPRGAFGRALAVRIKRRIFP